MEKPHWLTRLSILAPYAWLAAFFLAPFLIILKISLSQTAMAQPPYEPLLDLLAGWEGLRAFFARLSLDSYVMRQAVGRFRELKRGRPKRLRGLDQLGHLGPARRAVAGQVHLPR